LPVAVVAVADLPQTAAVLAVVLAVIGVPWQEKIAVAVHLLKVKSPCHLALTVLS
jgi:hypothetical protein